MNQTGVVAHMGVGEKEAAQFDPGRRFPQEMELLGEIRRGVDDPGRPPLAVDHRDAGNQCSRDLPQPRRGAIPAFAAGLRQAAVLRDPQNHDLCGHIGRLPPPPPSPRSGPASRRTHPVI